MTSKEFAEKMKEIFKDGGGELPHIDADELMIEALSSLGYEEGVKIFLSNEKWYAQRFG